MDNPEGIRCTGRWLGCTGSLATESRPGILGKSVRTGHQAAEEMEPDRAQLIVLALLSTTFRQVIYLL